MIVVLAILWYGTQMQLTSSDKDLRARNIHELENLSSTVQIIVSAEVDGARASIQHLTGTFCRSHILLYSPGVSGGSERRDKCGVACRVC